jgi:hypothetical protein
MYTAHGKGEFPRRKSQNPAQKLGISAQKKGDFCAEIRDTRAEKGNSRAEIRDSRIEKGQFLRSN